MLKLPNGITGFSSSKEGLPAYTDRKHFKQICYSVIHRYGGKINTQEWNDDPRSFYHIEGDINGGRIYFLLNSQYPYLAFAESMRFHHIQFIDVPILENEFSHCYQVLKKETLHKPLREAECDFNVAELKQIQYWKPATIGEVIFNFWD